VRVGIGWVRVSMPTHFVCHFVSELYSFSPLSSPPSAIASRNCLRCERGQFQPLSAQLSCSACPRGKWSDFSPHTEHMKVDTQHGSACDACPLGFFAGVSAIRPTKCTACHPGQYARNVGSKECELCEVGRYSHTLAGGEWQAMGASPCKECPKPKFNRHAGESKCYECRKGTAMKDTHTKRAHSDSCPRCQLGRYSDRVGEFTCKLCQAGKVRS
jgi:hypothetical protein